MELVTQTLTYDIGLPMKVSMQSARGRECSRSVCSIKSIALIRGFVGLLRKHSWHLTFVTRR